MNREIIGTATRRKFTWAAGLVVMVFLTSCRSEPEVKRYYRNPSEPASWSIAVAPFTNLSGSVALDVMAVTDEFYTELQQIEGGLQVIPVNRVLAVMQELQMAKVSSPEDVTALAEALQVDGIIVGTVTRYDPYPPPQMGMLIYLYDRKDWADKPPLPEIDAGKMARSGQPFDLKPAEPLKPRDMVVRIYDASKKDIVERIKAYAKEHKGKKTAEQWEQYTTSRNYLRFVAHETIGELLARQKDKIAGASQRKYYAD